jgi:hypothetical protein
MRRAIAALALVLATLAGCGDDPAPATDSEDYTGTPQGITSKRVDEPVYGTRTKYKTETYCKVKKANGTCKTYATRKVADGTETYEVDDRDWVLVLADGTEVDVDQAEYDRYQVGATYP